MNARPVITLRNGVLDIEGSGTCARIEHAIVRINRQVVHRDAVVMVIPQVRDGCPRGDLLIQDLPKVGFFVVTLGDGELTTYDGERYQWLVRDGVVHADFDVEDGRHLKLTYLQTSQ